MKKSILIILFLLFHLEGISQTYIKFNAATALLGIPGIAVEVPISKKFTFQLESTMSFWNSITTNKYNKRPYVFNQIFPEVRYFVKELNKGPYVGTHFGYGMFKISKNSSYAFANKYQYGYIFFAGLTFGYKWKLKERWMLDAYFGGGYSKATYEGFEKYSGIRYELENLINFSAQWIPYKGGLMIGYRF